MPKRKQRKAFGEQMGEGVTGLNRLEALGGFPKIAYAFLNPKTYIEMLRKKKK